jgi:hypothetical protein
MAIFAHRELIRERTWSRIHLVPLLLAEGDRDTYRREQAALEREKAIMKDVKGWEVSPGPLLSFESLIDHVPNSNFVSAVARTSSNYTRRCSQGEVYTTMRDIGGQIQLWSYDGILLPHCTYHSGSKTVALHRSTNCMRGRRTVTIGACMLGPSCLYRK